MRFPIAAVFALSACTFAGVGVTPMYIEGLGEVYRYQGRANFGYQISEADRVMSGHCAQVNGGRPVIVDQRTVNVGAGGIFQSQTMTTASGTARPTPGGIFASGQATTTGIGTGGVMANQNQEIWFRCVT